MAASVKVRFSFGTTVFSLIAFPRSYSPHCTRTSGAPARGEFELVRVHVMCDARFIYLNFSGPLQNL